MKYTVLIQESDDGFAASVLGLPGCHSQGETEAEALANIRDAIREYLDVVAELAATTEGKQVAGEDERDAIQQDRATDRPSADCG